MTDLIVVQRSPTIVVANGPAVPVPHAASHRSGGSDSLAADFSPFLHASQHAPGGTDELAKIRAAIRYQRQMDAWGYYAETSKREAINGNSLMVSGTVYYMSIFLFAGEIISAWKILNAVAGSAFSGVGMKFGLYNAAIQRLTQTGDVSATAGLGGAASGAQTPYTVLTDAAYYAAVLAIAGTPPNSSRGAGAVGGSTTGVFASGTIGITGHQTGQTDLPATGSLTFSSSSLPFWIGVA